MSMPHLVTKGDIRRCEQKRTYRYREGAILALEALALKYPRESYEWYACPLGPHFHVAHTVDSARMTTEEVDAHRADRERRMQAEEERAREAARAAWRAERAVLYGAVAVAACTQSVRYSTRKEAAKKRRKWTGEHVDWYVVVSCRVCSAWHVFALANRPPEAVLPDAALFAVLPAVARPPEA